MTEAEYQIEQNLERCLSTPNFSNSNQVDCRSVLIRFSCEEIKRVARELYLDGYRTDEKYNNMNVELMNANFNLSDRQKNALITFIMYAK
ncbi:hypothetical protein [Bacillus cereus]|uniref:hypothetical protein n=1 Tax=Bacillus cereus TaxID=1396 RepID=UPI00156A94EE|nr:hypothetical protein [Bacillus cereus]UDV85459.1 hypothetical protein HQJ03_029030 [Bacillus cereus]UDV91003.1 hypothetical protein HQG80_029015 [Bacillus cereus]